MTSISAKLCMDSGIDISLRVYIHVVARVSVRILYRKINVSNPKMPWSLNGGVCLHCKQKPLLKMSQVLQTLPYISWCKTEISMRHCCFIREDQQRSKSERDISEGRLKKACGRQKAFPFLTPTNRHLSGFGGSENSSQPSYIVLDTTMDNGQV